MANEISGGVRINAVPASREIDKQTHENQSARRVRKLHQKEVQVEETHIKEVQQKTTEDSEMFKSIVRDEYFLQSPQGQSAQEKIITDSKLKAQFGLTDADLASDATKIAGITAEEVEAFVEVLDPEGKKKEKFQELSEKLTYCAEGEEERTIDNAAKTICENNKAMIYLMLCSVYEDLIRKKAKEKLQDRLKKIILAFERQESAYLFSFFSFQNILSESPNSANAAILDKMANVSSGHVKLNSLRQTLQFVGQLLSDKDMHKMVSLFMKFQAKNLKKISSLSDGREDKEELANILQQERNLIILNSLYNLCKKLIFQLKKSTEVDEKYAEFMGHVITVIESSLVSVVGIQDMAKTLGIKQMTFELNRVFVKNFQNVIAKMPQPVFYNDNMRDKLLESLRNILQNIEKLMEPKSTGLSFLKRKISVFGKGNA